MNTTLLAAWEATLRSAPDAVAMVDAATHHRVTRLELETGAMSWQETYGAGLAGRLVLLVEANGPEWLRVFLGLLKAQAVIAPLDPGEPAAAQRATAEAIGAAWWWSGGRLQAVARGRPPARDGRRLVKLTSGSTGTPRALAFTDRQMLADGRQICAGMDIGPEDVNLGLIPFGHSYGLGNLVVPLLAQGTAIVSGVASFPHPMASAIAGGRVTVFPAVPALLRALVVADVPPSQLASLRTVISAGAPLAPEIASAFHAKFGRKVHSFYGSSETGGITYDATGDAASSGRSVGRPLPGVRLQLERGGRFSVTSAAVFTLGNRGRKTIRRPPATGVEPGAQAGAAREDVTGCGTHRPADIGALTAGGELVLLGRAGRFVKIAGRRLDLAEIEQALRALPGVRDAFVDAHAGRADALAAAVSTDETAEAIRGALRERVAAWKIPKKLVTLPTFPLTVRGKTDTAQLRRVLA